MVEVNIDNQTIIGSSDGHVDSFIGIPYAKKLNATTRFKHSQLYENCGECIEAKKPQPIPPQPYNALEDFFSNQYRLFNTFQQSEDCLYLNIWRKSHSNNKKAVVIYFYGGGFTQGHGTAHLYNPYHLVEQEDIIVITFNYRLGALGYLNWSYFNKQYDYNNGMSDQINVLKWVHQNITCFGGDPHNITLMGQSAGSMSIMALMQIPELDKYYDKVMLLSGTLHSDSIQTARSKAQHFDKLFNKHFAKTSLESLTNNELLKLMKWHESERGKSKSLDLIYQPIQSPKMTRSVDTCMKPIFSCSTNSEGDIYINSESHTLSPKRFKEVMNLFNIQATEKEVQTAHQQREMITKSYFKNMAFNFLKQSKSQHKWLARFDWCRPESNHFKSAYHILDMVFWFGNLDILTTNNYTLTQSDIRLSHKMMTNLAHFAKYSKMPWSLYDNDTQKYHTYK